MIAPPGAFTRLLLGAALLVSLLTGPELDCDIPDRCSPPHMLVIEP